MSDLHPQLQPYQPTADDPFDAVKAAHLLNRAGFGGTQPEMEKIMKLGPQAAIDELLRFPDAPAGEQDEDDVPSMGSLKDTPGNFREMSSMMAGKTPQERMAMEAEI